MQQLIIRYALPGLPLGVVLHVYNKLSTNNGEMIVDIAFLLIISVLAGNIVQQLWMLIFEYPKIGLAYNSEKRLVLKKISEILDTKFKASGDELYAIWESILYSEFVIDEIRTKDREIWQFYHSNAANALGLLIGSITSFVIFCFSNENNSLLLVLSIVFLFFSLVFAKKSTQTRHLVETLEKFWIEHYSEETKIKEKFFKNET